MCTELLSYAFLVLFALTAIGAVGLWCWLTIKATLGSRRIAETAIPINSGVGPSTILRAFVQDG